MTKQGAMGGEESSSEEGRDDPSRPGAGPRPLSSWVAAALALTVAVGFLLTTSSRSGIWDPPELDRADLARRIAIHLFGATDLELSGALNTMPTLSDLGSGELPFTSMALGLATFGLHDWAGRVPLALWGIAGALALYLFIARMVSARAALYSVIALVTMPAYFIQARTMLGDAVTMAAFAMCFCGLCGGMLEDRSRAALVGWLALGLCGGFAGYLSRGALIGVAAPLLGVGGSWLVLAGAGRRWPISRNTAGSSPAGRSSWAAWTTAAVGIACLLGGVIAFYVGSAPLIEHGWKQPQVLRVLGVAIETKPPVESTFDLTLRDLGHGLFPWSALIPFAIGRLFWLPRGLTEGRAARDLAVRVALIVGSATAYGVFAWLAPYTGTLAFAALALLAAIAGIVIYDFERGAPASAAFGIAVVGSCLVLLRDMSTMPLKTLAAYGLPSSALPKGFEPADSTLLASAAACFAIFAFLTWRDPPTMLDGEATLSGAVKHWLRRRIEFYEQLGRRLSSVWGGNLLFGFLVVEAALVGLGAMLVVGRRLGWASVTQMPQMYAYLGLNAWWALPLGLLLAPLLRDAARIGFAALLRGLRLPRAAGMALGALLAGALLSFGFYPALAAQLSPKEVFDTYGALHRPGEPLGVLGLSARVGRFYSGGDESRALSSPRVAHRWLKEGSYEKPPERRWLAFRERDLAELNALHRAETGQNLPVIDASSGHILLGSNQLAGRRNDNPLDAVILPSPPEQLQRPVDVLFGDQLQALGWELKDESGRLVEYVVPGRGYQLRFYYRVLKPIRRKYKTFIHIDGYGRRHNGDHDVLGGAYAMTRWLPGDVVVDRYDLTLEPNFTPGRYTVFYGFFIGKDRFEVTRGDHHEDRVRGGVLEVR